MHKKDLSAKVVFNLGRKHMLQSLTRCTSSSCDEYNLYQNKDSSCPVGIFIADYHAELEGLPSSDSQVLESLNVNPTTGVRKVLAALQEIHDTVPPGLWARRLKRLAKQLKF